MQKSNNSALAEFVALMLDVCEYATGSAHFRNNFGNFQKKLKKNLLKRVVVETFNYKLVGTPNRQVQQGGNHADGSKST